MLVGPVQEIFSAKCHGQGVAAVDEPMKPAWIRHMFLNRNAERKTMIVICAKDFFDD